MVDERFYHLVKYTRQFTSWLKPLSTTKLTNEFWLFPIFKDLMPSHFNRIGFHTHLWAFGRRVHLYFYRWWGIMNSNVCKFISTIFHILNDGSDATRYSYTSKFEGPITVFADIERLAVVILLAQSRMIFPVWLWCEMMFYEMLYRWRQWI